MPFDIGFIELCTILVVALVLLGPDKLPVAARTLSRWYNSVVRTLSSFHREIDRELQIDELKRQLNEKNKQAQSLKSSLHQDLQNFSDDTKSSEPSKVARQFRED